MKYILLTLLFIIGCSFTPQLTGELPDGSVGTYKELPEEDIYSFSIIGSIPEGYIIPEDISWENLKKAE